MIDLSTITTAANSFASGLLDGLIMAIYAIIVIVVMFFLGKLVSKYVAKLVETVLEKIELEKWIDKQGLGHALAGFTLTQIITVFIRVYIVFAFLGAAAQLINVSFFTGVILGILNYLPSLLQGLILVIGILFVAAYITNTIRSEKFYGSQQLALGVQILIGYIAIVLALPMLLPHLSKQILVLEKLLELFITAVILAFGLAVGLGFGLGIKSAVEKASLKHQDCFDDLFLSVNNIRKRKK